MLVPLLSVYRSANRIGKGQFGQVYRVVPTSDPQDIHALKLIILKEEDKKSNLDVQREVKCLDIIRKAKIPNTLRLRTYGLTKAVGEVCHWISMNLIPGQELFDYLSQHPGGLPELEVKDLFLQSIKVVHQLAKIRIVHRDLKPENFMYEKGKLTLVDFGLALHVPAGDEARYTSALQVPCGSALYAAPELLGGYEIKGTFEAALKRDTWSLGVILFSLLTGNVFSSFNPEEKEKFHEFVKERQSQEAVYQLLERYQADISRPWRRLLRKMLRVDWRERPSIEEILNDELFKPKLSAPRKLKRKKSLFDRLPCCVKLFDEMVIR